MLSIRFIVFLACFIVNLTNFISYSYGSEFIASQLLKNNKKSQELLDLFTIAKKSEQSQDFTTACIDFAALEKPFLNQSLSSKQLLNYKLALCAWKDNNWPEFKNKLDQVKYKVIKTWLTNLIISSIGDSNYYKIFLSADISYLLEKLPDLGSSYKFNLNYLPLLKDDEKSSKILKDLWLQADESLVLSKLNDQLKKEFKDLIDNATLKDWEIYYQTRFNKNQYSKLISITPDLEKKFQNPHPLIKYYLESLFAVKQYSNLVDYLTENPVLYKIYPAQISALNVESLLRTDRFDEAIKFINLVKGNSSLYHKLNYIVANWMFYFKQDYPGAFNYQNFIDYKELNKDDQADFNWQKLLTAFFVGNKISYDQVRSWYDQAEVKGENLDAHFCYWIYNKGKTYFNQDRTSSCFQKYRNQYYGLRAEFDDNFNRLDKHKFFSSKSDFNGSPPNDKDLFFIELIRISALYKDITVAEKMLQTDFINNNNSLSYLKAISDSLQDDDFYYLSQNIFVNILGGGSLDDEYYNPTFINSIYPLAYNKIVTKAAATTGVPSKLIYSIMREESHYNPEIVSGANAKGLMQLIDPTAKMLARSNGLDSGFNIFDPGANITLGSFYLKSLLNKFNNNLVKAIASYNAGPNSVTKWDSDLNKNDIDFYVESIPFGETRRYVKRVLRSYFVYSLTYE